MSDTNDTGASGVERHELAQRDAFEAIPDLEGDSAHAAVVDYPWTFSNQQRGGRADHENPEDWDMQDNARLREALDLLTAPLVDGAWVFVFADDDVYPLFREAVEGALTYRKTLIWDTKRIGLGHYFRSRHGYIIAGTNGDTDRHVTDVPTVIEAIAPQREPGVTSEYPTEKPAQLLEAVLDPVTSRGERVLEPFCGTAPALEAAKSLGLRYWGVDVSPDALEAAHRREGQSTLLTSTDGGERSGKQDTVTYRCESCGYEWTVDGPPIKVRACPECGGKATTGADRNGSEQNHEE